MDLNSNQEVFLGTQWQSGAIQLESTTVWYMLLIKVQRERLNVKYVFVLSFVFVRKY